MRQGRNEESLQVLTIEIPPSLARSDIAVWQKLTQGSALAYLAKFPEAGVALTAAQELAKASQPQLEGEALLRLGTLASLQRDLVRAQFLFHSCLDFARFRKDEYLEASALGSLGLVAARMDHYDESIAWNQQALDLDKANGWNGLAARAEGNMGWSYYLIGDLVNALDLYKKADQHDIDAGAPERRITWLNAAGDVYYDLRDFSAAQAASTNAFQLADSLHDTDDAIYCLQSLASISIAQRRFDSAKTYIDEALARETSAPDHVRELYSRLISAQLAVKTSEYGKAETIFQQIKSDPASPVHVHWEALSGLAQTHASQGKNARAEREFQEAIATIFGAQDSIDKEEFRLSFLSTAIQFYDQYINFLLGLHRPLDALKIADLSRAQTLEHGLSPSVNADAGGKKPALPKSASAFAIHPQETARRLGATLLFYQLGQEGSHLWVISPAKITLHSLPSAGEIDGLVATYRRSVLEDPRDLLESGSASGKKLYEMLIQPVESAIPKGARVIILPDGPLRSLNFESLPVYGANPHYWIEDATISVASSLSLLSHVSNGRPPNSPNLLLFGDPDPPTKEFPRLGDAREEIRAVQDHFDEKSTTLFLKKDARASVYLSSDPGKYSYLHFATHGIASVTKPLESAIILTREGDSYKLYARDIVQHRLNAYLVSISACDGSGKRNFAGEGLIGLSWAFLRAGAHNVVAGLWETSTASTPPIFDRLYEGVTHGEDPATALRNAKLALVHAKGPHRRPFYWAPFQLYSGS